nr:23S rRNA (pseudouridine(1915)-N(3))-methyltransferase RlmH [candidate division Zixibacteria bacterium]
MLKINIIAVGKNKETWVEEAINHYLKLLARHASVSFIYIPDLKKSRELDNPELPRLEAPLIFKKIKSSCTVALVDKGKTYTSEEFAEYISGLMMTSGGSVDFIIGGIHGLDKSILITCRETLSLSPMTMSHQLIRPVLLEQLYRAFSILSGGKYHK